MDKKIAVDITFDVPDEIMECATCTVEREYDGDWSAFIEHLILEDNDML